MIDLVERGKPYTGAIAEGAFADLFAPGGSLLKIGMPEITRPEAQAYRKGKVRFGLALKGGAILTLWKFGDQPWIDAPFDAQLARQHGNLELADVNPKSRLTIDLHLVDTATRIVKGIRSFTLTPAQTMAVCTAIQDQLSSGSSDQALAELLTLAPDALGSRYEIK